MNPERPSRPYKQQSRHSNPQQQTNTHTPFVAASMLLQSVFSGVDVLLHEPLQHTQQLLGLGARLTQPCCSLRPTVCAAAAAVTTAAAAAAAVEVAGDGRQLAGTVAAAAACKVVSDCRRQKRSALHTTTAV